MISRLDTYSKNSLAGEVALMLVILSTLAQFSVFHALSQDVQGSSSVKDAKK